MKNLSKRSFSIDKRPVPPKQFKTISMNQDEDDFDGGRKEALYSVSHNQQSFNQFIVRIHAPISAPSDYAGLLTLFDNATENDHILLDILSPGGSLDTCILICRAIRHCDGHITARIGSTCASAATAIALACDDFEIDQFSSFMVHTGSIDLDMAKIPDLRSAVIHHNSVIENFIYSTYSGFLTEEEIEDVIAGKELYFVSEELEEKLNNLMTYREEMAMQEECCDEEPEIDGPTLEELEA